jgi:deazaflavin-dependent oxidoreductase (nitroreductase family)
MARDYKLTGSLRLLNSLVKIGLRFGLGSPGGRLLTVRGRKTGRDYTTPVNIVERDGQWFLVSPYGERGWTRNARATGQVTLRRGGKQETRHLEELSPAEATPILREYLKRNSITRPYFDLTLDSPDEAFVVEAPRHPVFRLT